MYCLVEVGLIIMVKLDAFSIELDHPQGVYFPGGVLRGFVKVVVNRAMHIRGIFIYFEGKATVKWTSGSGKNKETYENKEKYFEEKILLVGSDEDMMLREGSYNFPFEYCLSTNLPSSFEQEYGGVRYLVKAKIDRPWKFDKVKLRPFTILRALDLNNESRQLWETHTETEAHEMSSCCCDIGTVTAHITLNRRCFVPGETIFINGWIKNNSEEIISCRCSLTQLIQFFAPTHSVLADNDERAMKEMKSYEVKVEHGETARGQTDVWTNVPLRIPALPPSRLDGCSIINIQYLVKFWVNDWKFAKEIIIGMEPLREAVPSFYAAPPVTAQPGPWAAAPPSAPPTEHKGLLPPSLPPSYDSYLPTCEECVTGRMRIFEDEDEERSGNMVWAPRYITYQFPPSANTAVHYQNRNELSQS